MTEQDKYADKIAKLLNKAESTTAEEAELLIAKAQELMMRYAIDQAILDAARGKSVDEIGQIDILFTGNYRYEHMMIAYGIARLNNCRAVEYQVLHDDGGRKAVRVTPDGNGGFRSEVTAQKKAYKLVVTGYKSDLETVRILESSLRLQAVSGMVSWWTTEKPLHPGLSYAHSVKMRSEWVEGFAASVRRRMAEAVERSRTDAAKDHGRDSVALVVRSREKNVEDWFNDFYTGLRNTRARSRTTLNPNAKVAGRAAGDRADVGQPKFGKRKEIRS